ncbi:hypothetical protein [Nocardia sp. X0981]
MNALIIVAVVLIAVGLLISLALWFRHPRAGSSEYVTVAELQARLEDEHGHPEQAPDTAGPTTDDAGPGPMRPAEDSPAAPASTEDEEPTIGNVPEETGDNAAAESAAAGSGPDQEASEETSGPQPDDRDAGDTPTGERPDRGR